MTGKSERRGVRRRRAALVVAAAASVPGVCGAAVVNDAGFTGPGAEFVVSTSGATALGAFTRGRNADNSYNRGPFALGVDSLRIGRTTYQLDASGQFIGSANTGALLPNEPGAEHDRFVYKYHETGSIAGILELVDSNGLLVVGGVPQAPRRPLDPNTANPLFINGNRTTAPGTAAGGGYSTGSNYDAAGVPLASQTGQELARIAWSDVRTEQAFAVSGSAAYNRRPTEAGYGLGRGNIGNTNFQRLRSADQVLGGVDPATTRLRNEALAVVPFNLVANPGTGLSRLTKEEGLWLQVAGRLPNGANFNVPTRDSGSGTRNQGVNNLGGDPTWGAGERDRIALGTYTTIDPDGNTITVNPGDEADPRRSLTGSTVANLNESRVSPTIRYADKTSGSTGIRTTAQASRMAAGGILSSGDSGAFARDATTTQPIRALAIDWGNGAGFVQARAQDVTEGRYEMWSASQAVTVTPVGHTIAMDTDAPGGRPIFNDQNDEAALPVGGSSIGAHRKYLDNVTRSVATLSSAPTNLTPVDAILAAGFIPPAIMGVTKPFDGSPQSPRGRLTLDPDGPGPQLSEQQIWSIVAESGGALDSALNWADPSTHNGALAGGGVRYNLYAPTNTLSSSNSNADLSIVINGRTNLAGDLNNDGVRDLADVPRLALAYASPQEFLSRHGGETTTADSTANDGSSLNSTVVSARGGGLLGAAPSPGLAALAVLTDLDSNGNVRETAPGSGTYTIDAVERGDVRYFLYGAAIDTSGFASAQARREDGVRLGQLRKNAAIDQFNSALDALVDNGQAGDVAGFTQAQADALKFDKFDVNGDGVADRQDAKLVDAMVGRDYRNLSHQLSSPMNLVDVELTDDGVISHAAQAGVSDTKLIVEHLTGLGRHIGGDADFSGRIDIADYFAIDQGRAKVGGPANYGRGDFDFSGLVNADDYQIIDRSFLAQAAGGGPLSISSARAVPEPGALGAVAMAMVTLLRRRRGVQRH